MRSALTSISAGLIASIIAHVMLIVAVAVPHHRQTAHGETVAVELLPADEAPALDAPAEAAPPPEAKPEAQPDWSQLPKQAPAPEQNTQSQRSASASRQQASRQQTPQQSRQQPQAEQEQQPQQQVQPPQSAEQAKPDSPEPPAETPTPMENPAEQGARLAALLGLQTSGDLPDLKQAEINADIESGAMAAFKAHLKKCWTAPEGYSDTQKIKVVMRVMLRKDGKLAKDPEAVEVAPASAAFPSFKSAVTALRKCQPYTMLPAEKYNEWRVLDINMSPDQMTGG